MHAVFLSSVYTGFISRLWVSFVKHFFILLAISSRNPNVCKQYSLNYTKLQPKKFKMNNKRSEKEESTTENVQYSRENGTKIVVTSKCAGGRKASELYSNSDEENLTDQNFMPYNDISVGKYVQ